MKMALLSFCLFSSMSVFAATPMSPNLTAQDVVAAYGEIPSQEVLEAQPNLYSEEEDSPEYVDDVPPVILAGGRHAPVWGTFMSNFHSCAPGCAPANYETFGSRGHASCHNSGRAIDVGAIVCHGRTYEAIHGGRFSEFVSCMRSKMKTLYRNGRGVTQGHHDHAHFSIGCIVSGGRNYY